VSDDDSNVVECEIFIAAPPEVIFPFLVEPKLMEHCIGIARTGGRAEEAFAIAMDSGHVARGAYTLVSPPHRIAFTWGWEGQEAFPPGTSLVEIELLPQDEGTLVRLRHSRLPEDAPPLFSPEGHRARWSRYLARLKTAIGVPR
jgi:uncharacterized protein YndB with AHSA1/START domain